MDKVLAPAPAEMPIRELVETVVNTWKTDEPWDADDLDDEATVELEEPTYPRGGYSLKMWKKKGGDSRFTLRSNSEDIHLYLIDGKIQINHRQRYNPTCFDEAEALIFKLYAAGTVITGLSDFDPEDCDLTLKEGDY